MDDCTRCFALEQDTKQPVPTLAYFLRGKALVKLSKIAEAKQDLQVFLAHNQDPQLEKEAKQLLIGSSDQMGFIE